MGLPAALPSEPLPGGPEPEWDQLQREMVSLLDEFRSKRPADGSAEESRLMAEFYPLGLRSLRVLGLSYLDVVRKQLHAALKRLVAQELASAEVERKLALRHIQHSVDRYGVLIEASWPSLAKAEAASLDGLIQKALQTPWASRSDDEKLVTRFQVGVLVALSVMDAPLDELTFWAFRTINDARRVDAFLAQGAELRRLGEHARHRTHGAWSGWSADEIADEVAPWPRSP